MGNIFTLTTRGATKAFMVPNFWKQQAAALCVRKDGDSTEVLLITGSGNGRWGIPKGTIEAGERSFEAAEREAFEEAGVRGRIDRDPVGVFHYFKAGRIIPHEVHVHLLYVDDLIDDFQEAGERSLDWTPLRHAPGLVARQGLSRVLAEFEADTDRPRTFGELGVFQN
jgi:8-oxo-dGTP pyrophosphatase MutT (NUDIX family)